MQLDLTAKIALAALGSVLVIVAAGPVLGTWAFVACAAAVAAIPAPKTRWTRYAAAGAAVVALVVEPWGGPVALQAGAAMLVLGALGVSFWGVPPRAWVPSALLAGAALAIGLLPPFLLSRVSGLSEPTFLLLVATAIGAPCVAIAYVRRARHLELTG